MKELFRSFILLCFLAPAAMAEETELRLAVPQELENTGVLQFIVPRFSLKTSVRMARVAEGASAQMRIGSDGTPVFAGAGRTWSFEHDGDPRAVRFLDWLTSEVGVRTIESFEGADGMRFRAPEIEQAAAAEIVFTGDARRGEVLSLEKCGRCHVVTAANRMTGIGSTPSFALVRTFEDWHTRFATFHLLKPHPSFTQVEGVTEAFDPALPPPIVPVTITLDDLEAILAFVAEIAPADLGAPLQFQ